MESAAPGPLLGPRDFGGQIINHRLALGSKGRELLKLPLQPGQRRVAHWTLALENCGLDCGPIWRKQKKGKGGCPGWIGFSRGRRRLVDLLSRGAAPAGFAAVEGPSLMATAFRPRPRSANDKARPTGRGATLEPISPRWKTAFSEMAWVTVSEEWLVNNRRSGHPSARDHHSSDVPLPIPRAQTPPCSTAARRHATFELKGYVSCKIWHIPRG